LSYGWEIRLRDGLSERNGRPAQLCINLQQQIRVISQIPALLLDIRPGDTLRGNTARDIRKSLDRLVRNRALPLDNKHQEFRGTTLVARDARVQILAVAVHGLGGGIKVTELDDRLAIDAHTIPFCDEAESLDEFGQGAMLFIPTTVVENEDSPACKVFRLQLTLLEEGGARFEDGSR
jgi:hypothetical protein